MDSPPSLGRRAAATATATAKAAGDDGMLPSVWVASSTSTSTPTAAWWPWSSASTKALRTLLLRSGIGARRRRARLMAAVIATLVFWLGLLYVQQSGSSSGSSSRGTGTGQRTMAAAADQKGDVKPPVHPASQTDVAFPMTTRAFITAEQLTADPSLQVPVQLPFDGKVVTRVEDGQRDVQLSTCRIDIAPYHRSPAKFPKAKHLYAALCDEDHGLDDKVSARALLGDTTAGRQLQPSGFIFHESRVGSTLVANMLASVPTNLVYSEPHLPIHVVKQCKRAGCSEAETVELLRLAVLAMGRSRHHDQLFIKFQSSFVPSMPLLLKAFPNTPWVFIYRNPVEVMVSNLGGDGNDGGPCTSHKASAPAGVQAILGVLGLRAAASVDNAEYCAAHLAFLCDTALGHLRADGSRGYAVAYERLVDELLDVVLPGHFGLALSRAEHARMLATAAVYSKGSVDSEGDDALFHGDAEEKRATANAAIRQAVEAHLRERTAALEALTAARRPGVAAEATLRTTQEAYVYERTGSRSFGAPSCSDEPAYPVEYPVVDMVRNWNPDDPSVAARHYASLCRFDYRDEAARAKAARYVEAGVPFVVYNLPAVDATAAKWGEVGYLEGELGDAEMRVEISETNHFLYFSNAKARAGYKPPTHTETWTYADWRRAATERVAAVAAAAAAASNDGTTTTPIEARRAQEHYYFRISSGDHDVVEEDVTIFGAAGAPAFFKRGDKERGIHCRFGMEGIVAEPHYDGHRNFVVALGGTRRWILSPPKECAHAYLRPPHDPSGRHSAVDWAAPDLDTFPEFAHMTGTEVLLTPGDVLYVPSFWIHYIASLGFSAQCNSRSGRDLQGMEEVQACGFHV